MIRPTNQNGFTIIELTLAMTFVSVLLLTIAVTVVQMSMTYNRGMAIKEVNQLSRDLADDLRRSVQATSVFSVDTSDGDTAEYVTMTQSVDGVEVVTTGRLCLGNYSYIWNTATAIETNFADMAHYLNSNGTNGEPVSFAKVADTGKKYCSKDTDGALRYPNILYADTTDTSELLKSGDRTIRMIDFNVTSDNRAYDPVSGQRLYTVSYRLGTGETSAMEFVDGQPVSCLPPNDPNSNLAYCNVQQFSIVLRAGNTVN